MPRARSALGHLRPALRLVVFRPEKGSNRRAPGREARFEQAALLTLDTFQQRAAAKANTARGQVVAVFTFLAERLRLPGRLGAVVGAEPGAEPRTLNPEP